MGLEQMIRKLREMVGEIRDNAHSMLKSQVKSLIVRTATKLSFMTQAMVTKEVGLQYLLDAARFHPLWETVSLLL